MLSFAHTVYCEHQRLPIDKESKQHLLPAQPSVRLTLHSVRSTVPVKRGAAKAILQHGCDTRELLLLQYRRFQRTAHKRGGRHH